MGTRKVGFVPLPTLRFTAIKLSQGEHAGSPLQSMNTRGFVGAYLCVCP
ncbi:hypothetical protein QUF54_07515 [Candidatus Marithioploca araucensis]|uniref:Uncharacterized protein n=1 Tax=Candidatus Marithioploca araucensis TaxID=70273 RepID=A0ABT7VUH4_9GAMM|nr:hypothetical protein [Candidatus Marithioploca araucensis]